MTAAKNQVFFVTLANTPLHIVVSRGKINICIQYLVVRDDRSGESETLLRRLRRLHARCVSGVPIKRFFPTDSARASLVAP